MWRKFRNGAGAGDGDDAVALVDDGDEGDAVAEGPVELVDEGALGDEAGREVGDGRGRDLEVVVR